MAFTYPLVADFKNQFVRDFPYGTDPTVAVVDADIVNASVMANMTVNPSMFSDQGFFNLCFNLVTAHFLVMNLRSSSQGISGQFNFLEQSKSVGSISQSFAIPQRILDNPQLALLAKTNYGAQYLSLVIPLLSGQIFYVCGGTQA